MLKSEKLKILLLIFLFTASVARGDESSDEAALNGVYGDENIISIATGTEQPIAKAPAVATVITARQIRDMGATDLDQVLETVPGLHVSHDPYGYEPVYIFRGIYAQYNPQVLLLINGIPQTALLHGGRNLVWAGMPVEDISRVEVIRGPGSAVYGADAFAGIINVITKTADEMPKLEAGVRYGSFDTRDAWLLSSNDVGRGRLGLALEYHITNGQRQQIDADAQTALDQLYGTHASLAPGRVNLSRNNLDARLDYSLDHWQFRAGLQRRSDVGSGAGVAQALDPSGRYLSERWNTDLTYHNADLSPLWDVTAQISILNTSVVNQRNLLIYPPGTNPLGTGVYPDGFIGNPEVYERHSRADFSAFYSGIDRHQIRIGTGYYYGEVYNVHETKNYGPDPATGLPLPPGAGLVDVSNTPYVFLPKGHRADSYAFLQDVWNFLADWELTSGVRYDYYSDFGDTTNPRLALVWSTTRNLTTKLLYGRAFRSPSFVQTQTVYNPVVQANPNLKPETMESYECAFNYKPMESLRLDLNLFHYNWEDIIQLVHLDPNSQASIAENAGAQIGNGGEFEVNWEWFDNVKLNASYSYLKAKDENTQSTPPQSPSRQAFVSVDWKFADSWNISGQANRIMGRHRQVDDPRPPTKNYTLVNLTLRHQASHNGFGYALAVRNLFDADAREPSPWAGPTGTIPNDLPLAGRSFYIEASYVFQ